MLNQNSRLLLPLATLLLSAFSVSSLAYPPRPRENPPRPPQEAIEACESLSEGDSCSFEGRHQELVTGMCVTLKEDEALLACKPERGGPEYEERREPPAQ